MIIKSANFRKNKLLCANDGFKLRCLVDREMDVRTSALVDDEVAECLNGLFCCDLPRCSSFCLMGLYAADSCCL